jgi:tripartite-type tricarboxylate transporter receptor subunit TctC
LNDVLHYKFKVVRGYGSTGQIDLAMERGELQGNGALGLASLKARQQQWIDDKKVKFILQYGLKRDPDLPDVPSVFEQTKNEADTQAMRMLFARTEYGRPYFLPPDVPKDRVEALRRAFDKTMKDPEFIADAAKLQLDVTPMTGEEVQDLIGQLAATPPDIVARVHHALDVPAAK